VKVLLVAPKFIQKVGTYYTFPLGLAYISSVLKKAGHDVCCLNLNHQENAFVALVEMLEIYSPDVVGTGGLSPSYNTLKDILTVVKTFNPNTRTMLGGGALTSEPELVLENTPTDVGIIGEGEITVVELLDAWSTGADLSCVNGIIYKTPDGTTIRTQARDAIKDLDTIPWPDYDGFEIETLLANLKTSDGYHLHFNDDPRAIDLISSRSCPFSCTFCFHPLGKVYRERSLDNFFAELDYLVTRYRINQLSIMDELFAAKKERLVEFCRRIKPYQIAWTVQLHVTSVDEAVLDLMRGAGCTYISYGIESMNEAVLVSMKKSTSTGRTHKALQDTYDRAIGIQGNLIFGDPAETLATALESLTWWSENRHFQLTCYDLGYFPGSHIYETAIRKGAIKDRLSYIQSGCPLVNATGMDDDSLHVLRYVVETSQRTMFLPARDVVAEEETVCDPVRGKMLTLSWSCVHCGAPNLFKHVPVDTIYFGDECATIRLSCRICNRRVDIPTKPVGKQFSPTISHKINMVYHYLQTGNKDAASGIMKSILTPTTAEMMLKIVLSQEPEHPRANYLSGLLAIQNGEASQAVTCMKKAIQGNPYVPMYFEGMARALDFAQWSVFSNIFQRQSLILRLWQQGFSLRDILSQSNGGI
jgi:radical SAM superfamily enzyme YgiQ (UPF0313 family)